jgi:hypothetical protein
MVIIDSIAILRKKTDRTVDAFHAVTSKFTPNDKYNVFQQTAIAASLIEFEEALLDLGKSQKSVNDLFKNPVLLMQAMADPTNKEFFDALAAFVIRIGQFQVNATGLKAYFSDPNTTETNLRMAILGNELRKRVSK